MTTPNPILHQHIKALRRAQPHNISVNALCDLTEALERELIEAKKLQHAPVAADVVTITDVKVPQLSGPEADRVIAELRASRPHLFTTPIVKPMKVVGKDCPVCEARRKAERAKKKNQRVKKSIPGRRK